MNIVNTIPFFMNNYQPSLEFLRSYYAKYPDVFTEYFPVHCKNTDERLEQALTKYEDSLPTIEKVHEHIIPIINEVAAKYNAQFGINFPIDVNLIVGAFGSNAFTHRQIIPNITFCLERLSTSPDDLSLLVAHEFGHHTHNKLTDIAGINWKTKDWFHPFTTLTQEGTATFLSKQILPNKLDYQYLAIDHEGEDWYNFAVDNRIELIQAFYEDYQKRSSAEVFYEWFSINGGKRYGLTRLGYFIGLTFFEELVEDFGKQKAIIAWHEEDYFTTVEDWFQSFKGVGLFTKQ
ncbi:hypothetical protein [Alkalihalobacillus sp. 1P02AB]|uniref:hypothetical protein n=1 Tax=Alkalihalobacillus sp. 1P02AB TaxID=3132260 RepID=UPI0039A603A0